MPEYAYSMTSSSPSISLDGSSQPYQQNYNQNSAYNEFLQPEEIFQLDQPIRPNYNFDSNQSKSPSTLLDLESGTIHKNNLDNTNIWYNSESYKYESSCDDTNSLTSGSSLFDDFYQNGVGGGGVTNQLQQNSYQSQDYLNYDGQDCSQYYSIKSEPQNYVICDQNNLEQYNNWEFQENFDASTNLGLVQVIQF